MLERRDYKEAPVLAQEIERANTFADNVSGHSMVIMAWYKICEVYLVIESNQYALITSKVRDYLEAMGVAPLYECDIYEHTEDLVFSDELLEQINHYLEPTSISVIRVSHLK